MKTPALFCRHIPVLCRASLAAVFGTLVGLSDAAGQTNRPGNPLRIPPVWTGGTLTAAPTNQTLWPGFSTGLLAINGSVPSPTIRVQRGSNFTARIENRLTNDLVIHWHGIVAPPNMDGHPRDAVPPGQSYTVDFPIRQRAGTYFYHPHTEPLTGELVYRGLAGAFIVEDPAETALGLPGGDHDIPLLVQDKRLREDRQVIYDPSMQNVMTGLLGDTVLVNATPEAYLSVDKSLYRFRLINGSNARVYKLGFSDARPFHLIATDGGLLAVPVAVTSAFLAPGERVEILVDFGTNQVGDSVTLKSLEFDPAAMGGMGHGTMNCTGMMTMAMMSDTNAMDPMHLTGTMTMSCTMETNHVDGGMGEMHPTNGAMTMNCSGMMTMMSGTNTMPGDMSDTNTMDQMHFTGTMTMTCAKETNHLNGGMDDMHPTNGAITMNCTGMITMMSGTNSMAGEMSDTNMMDQMHFTGTMTMTCTMDTNHLAGGIGEMGHTNSTWTMTCTGMMPLMAGTNAMPGDMMDTNSMIQMQMTGTMTCLMGNNHADAGTNSMGGMESTQGMEMEILQFDVDREGTGSPVVPAALATLTTHDPAQARRTRTFTLDMLGMAHAINGVMFDVNRVDFRVPFSELEIWEFRNTTDEIHPMHPHGALFQVLDRNGDTNLPPENRGWKDTMIVWPNETVRLLIRFEAYAGVFVSHCHNLEHEDSGMMQNFEVLPVRLAVGHQGDRLAFSFPGPATNYVLEVAERLGPGAQWIRLNNSPVAAGDQVQISIPKPSGDRFYRLLKLPEDPGSGTDPHAGHH